MYCTCVLGISTFNLLVGNDHNFWNALSFISSLYFITMMTAEEGTAAAAAAESQQKATTSKKKPQAKKLRFQ
jgi:hypothetical protein